MSSVCNHLHGMKEAEKNTSDELFWIHLQRWLRVSTPTSAKESAKSDFKIHCNFMPVMLVLLIERARSRQQPLPHDGASEDGLFKAMSLGKSLMAIPEGGDNYGVRVQP
jgi:hypothetical protein